MKKVLANGAPCPKCGDVERRLEESGLMARIDYLAVADEREPNSEGMRLARLHGVDVAPFFLVENNGTTVVHRVYFKFAKEVLGGRDRAIRAVDEAREILRANPDLNLSSAADTRRFGLTAR
ncbi:MAG: hypothetical protein OXH52_13675 [Gammaproteobacteria bacterium]|nr:hypothetical protein [Gammaproteobacteria bacterium]